MKEGWPGEAGDVGTNFRWNAKKRDVRARGRVLRQTKLLGACPTRHLGGNGPPTRSWPVAQRAKLHLRMLGTPLANVFDQDIYSHRNTHSITPYLCAKP